MIDITQYGGIWAMECDAALALLNYVREVGAKAHISHVESHLKAMEDQKVVAGNVGTPANNDGSVTVIPIFGTMMKKASSFSDAASTVAVRRTLQNAARDPDVKSAILHIDSPGGTVAGTQDLAQEVKNFAAKKPIYAFCEDMCASAAYWVASQANKIYAANNTTLIGSIGAYFGLYDLSKWAENNGVKPILFTTGKYKTVFPGMEVTKDQIEYLQSRVDQMQSHFSAAVRDGRSLSTDELNGVTDGRVFLAGEAGSRKLSDGIRSLSEVVAEAEAASRPSVRSGKAATMPRENMATPSQLRSALPGASAEFILAQCEKEATLAEATSAWMVEERSSLAKTKTSLDEREKAMNEREAKLVEREAAVKTREDEIAKTKGGARKLEQDTKVEGTAKSPSAGAAAQIEQLTQERMAAKKIKHAEAYTEILRENVQLRTLMVAEANASQREHQYMNGVMID